MKSAIITVTSSGQGIEEALSMTERFGKELGLAGKPVLHLRLLAEELFGMLRSIAGSVEASYWLDADGKKAELHMNSDVEMSLEMREKFLSASSSGRNDAAKGLMGRIRDMIGEMLLTAQDSAPYSMYNSNYLYSADDPFGDYVWSMSYYVEELQKKMETAKEAQEAWDELEKSIVASIADDIKVRIKGRNVEIILIKAF